MFTIELEEKEGTNADRQKDHPHLSVRNLSDRNRRLVSPCELTSESGQRRGGFCPVHDDGRKEGIQNSTDGSVTEIGNTSRVVYEVNEIVSTIAIPWKSKALPPTKLTVTWPRRPRASTKSIKTGSG